MQKHIGKVYAGKLFNKLFKDTILVKFTNEAEIHNGFKFEKGLNVDSIPFNPYGSCTPGGIYITEFDNAELWIDYNDNNNNSDNEPMHYCWTVTIPDDAQVYIEEDKLKADQIILSNRIPIDDLDFKEENLVENGFSAPIAKELPGGIYLDYAYSSPPLVYNCNSSEIICTGLEFNKNLNGC
uniref:Uncharacterized protein n=1 Tax=Mimivirus LCMiAC01 TaxID=2506608 RepID=A0A481Z0T5_9VIRU|nr:MAG: hypothetical protein LCMiAC01_03630 [Mimivirus LCMiAC01]